jgi:DNA-binding NarL/FixJ family response regulator
MAGPGLGRRTAEEEAVGSGHTCAHGQRRAGDTAADIRVLVVDDQPLVRTALTELLSDEDDMVVVGECEDGSQVVEAAQRLRPDVVLMDLSMPEMDGVSATKAMCAAHAEPRIVVLTGEGSAVRPTVAAAGAHALVPKEVRVDELLRCLRTVVVGCGCCPYCF